MEMTQQELPRYKTDKNVWALKIQAIAEYTIPNGPDAWQIFPSDPGYGPIVVSDSFVKTYRPQVGGYWVQYQDGPATKTYYQDAEAFEKSNTRDDGQSPIRKYSVGELLRELTRRLT